MTLISGALLFIVVSGVVVAAWSVSRDVVDGDEIDVVVGVAVVVGVESIGAVDVGVPLVSSR